MNLRLTCPKCHEDKLSHLSKNGAVLSVTCRNCKWTKELNKDYKKIKDNDYDV